MKWAFTNPDIIEPCPKCRDKSGLCLAEAFDFKWRIECAACGVFANWRLSPEEAVEEWNRK